MTDRYAAYVRRRSERLREEEAQRAFQRQQRAHAAAVQAHLQAQRDYYVQQTAWHIAEACAELSMPAHGPRFRSH